MFLPPLDFFIVNVALPSIKTGLGAGPAAQQLIISAYASVYAVTLITGGRLGDLYGRSRVFFAGIVGFGLREAARCCLSRCLWSQDPLIGLRPAGLHDSSSRTYGG